MIRSTFAGFNMASLALSASQRALDVTGQNLSNIHTTGYTRQRLDQISLNPVANSISSSAYDAKVGQGVMMTGVSQIRDPFLDIQYRNQLPKVGTANAEDAILSQIGQIFDETDKDAIAYQFQQVISQLQNLADPENTGTNSADTVVRSACEILLNTIHQNGTKVQEVYDELKTKMDETIVPEINGYLRDIAELNKSIKNTQILGNPALELQDDRNELVDALATYFPIEATYEKQYVGAGEYVDILNVNLKLSDGSKINLIHDDEYGEVGITKNADGKIVEPVDFFVKESGANGKTYGGGVDNLEKALPAEINGYINDIVNLNNDIKNYIDAIANTDAKIKAEQDKMNDYLADVAELNEKIYEEKQKTPPDRALIRSLEKQRTSTMNKLGDYFPKDSLTSTIDKDTGIMSVTAKAGDGTVLDLVATSVTGTPPTATASSVVGNVALQVADDGRIMINMTSAVTAAGVTPQTGTARSGYGLYDLELQRKNLVNDENKARTERENKLKGLNSYLPAGTIDDPVIEPATGYMTLTAKGQTLIGADNKANEITLEVNRKTGTNELDPPVNLKLGATDLGSVPEEQVNRMLEVMGEKISEGVVRGDLDMLNKAEIFDKSAADGKDATDTKGIQYYQKMLDTFVDQFARTMNELNKTTDENGATIENPLFEAVGGEPFTAANIKISDRWMNGTVHIQTEKDSLADGNSSDNWNVERMINALSTTVFDFKTPDGDKVFSGTLYECYTNIQGTQSVERKATSQILNTHTTVLDQIADEKDSVSGVWMDEEVMSLMKYTQSYNAASRLMTTMDEILERLITQTGVCGR